MLDIVLLTIHLSSRNKNKIETIRHSVNHGKLFGDDNCSDVMINKYKLMTTVRKRGRQNKGTLPM